MTMEFRTPADVLVPAVTADEMRTVDRIAVEEFGLGLLQMMENAGRTLASHARAVGDGPFLVIAGNGGNGGGGMACARHLSNHGHTVEVILDRDPAALTGAAERQYGILEKIGVPVSVGPEAIDRNRESGVLIDALIGYGLSGRVREPARELIGSMKYQSDPVVSLDVPSGIDATTGESLGEFVEPDRVVTLALPKTGLGGLTGPMYLADVSIPPVIFDRLAIEYEQPYAQKPWVELMVTST